MKKKHIHALLLSTIIFNTVDISAQNTKYGVNALANVTTGNFNTGLGYYALYNNTTGYYNSATGAYSLYSNTSGTGNTANGFYSLFRNTTGRYNKADGYYALASNTTGVENTALGAYALYSNSTASYNTATGSYSLYRNTTGFANTASGHSSLYNNTTGFWNLATGYRSLYTNTTGGNNIAIGNSSLFSNTTGGYNTAIGNTSLYFNRTGTNNTASGYSSLYANTTGSGNVANGWQSLGSNTTGGYNSASGMKSMGSNTAGWYNMASGYYTLAANTTGYGNTAAGSFAMYLNTTGSYNKADGYSALYNNTTGRYNTALGAFADVTQGGFTNATAIGYNALVNASNKVVIGANVAGMVIGGYAPWSNFSDGRFKENVKEDVPGLKFITRLRPVTYTINTNKLEDYLMRNMPDSAREKRMEKNENKLSAAAKIQTGFVAQEVEKTAKEMGYDFDGVNAPQNPSDNYSISYSQFVVPLVKAVQELAKMNEEKDAKIDSLGKQLDELKRIVLSGKSTNLSPVQNTTKLTLTNVSLEQNNPNPFTNNTTIRYTLPHKFSTAQITITDLSGKLLKQLNVTGFGKGSVELDTRTLSAGMYNYSLMIDGQMISTRQMLLRK